MPRYPQAIYWILTIPANDFDKNAFDPLPDNIQYLTGQLECPQQPDPNHSDECQSWNDLAGGQDWDDCTCHVTRCGLHSQLAQLYPVEGAECICPKVDGFRHWQLVVGFRRKLRLAGVKAVFGERCHAEPTRSKAAIDYVHKDDTAVANTRFTLGSLPVSRGRDNDWERIRDDARRGELDSIPGDVYVRLYSNLKRIATDHMRPTPIERTIVCFWGATGVGKSRRAWDEAGFDAFPKDPRTKFWDGYAGQEHVVIDEFRGGIDIAHVLRWFDRYPVVVEVKGSSVVLKAKKIWITSNLPPEEWYPGLDEATKQALLRRIEVHHLQ